MIEHQFHSSENSLTAQFQNLELSRERHGSTALEQNVYECLAETGHACSDKHTFTCLFPPPLQWERKAEKTEPSVNMHQQVEMAAKLRQERNLKMMSYLSSFL